MGLDERDDLIRRLAVGRERPVIPTPQRRACSTMSTGLIGQATTEAVCLIPLDCQKR
jgi:hypothetical protein